MLQFALLAWASWQKSIGDQLVPAAEPFGGLFRAQLLDGAGEEMTITEG
jgi:hypothetical protein